MPKQIIPLTTISLKEIKEAIKHSGYLLEQRLEPILEKHGYYVQTNPAFPDLMTGKSREFDVMALSATKIYKKGFHFVFPVLLCECENNAQPVVFFTKESLVSFLYHEEVKCSGLPVKFWEYDGFISLSEFTGMEKFHHYCKGSVATQYCTFQMKKDKSSWMAFHSEEQHDAFSSLIQALESEVAQHFDAWVIPEKGEEEYVNIQIYYPLLILQGLLYSAYLRNSRLYLKKVDHVQFRKEVFSSKTNEPQKYQIDVISESFLPKFLKVVDSEVEKVKKVFQRKRPAVKLSIQKIVEEAKRLRKKPKSYWKILEF